MDSLIDLTTEDHMIDDDVVITGVTPAAAPESTGGPAASHQRQILIAEEVSASKHAEHNLRIYNEMRPGDLLEFYRGLYTHWGVCIGDGQIIHLSGEDDDGIRYSSILGKPYISGAKISPKLIMVET
jgi:cell wall-associated NlpC family hydrolase